MLLLLNLRGFRSLVGKSLREIDHFGIATRLLSGLQSVFVVQDGFLVEGANGVASKDFLHVTLIKRLLLRVRLTLNLGF